MDTNTPKCVERHPSSFSSRWQSPRPGLPGAAHRLQSHVTRGAGQSPVSPLTGLLLRSAHLGILRGKEKGLRRRAVTEESVGNRGAGSLICAAAVPTITLLQETGLLLPTVESQVVTCRF